MYRQRIQSAWGNTVHRGWARLLLYRARDLITHGPAHRGANGAAMPTDEDDQDGHFFLTTPREGATELELELIQSHMAQKPMLRGKVGCACVAREVSVEGGGMGERGCARLSEYGVIHKCFHAPPQWGIGFRQQKLRDYAETAAARA